MFSPKKGNSVAIMGAGASSGQFAISSGDTRIGTTLNDAYLTKKVGPTLMDPFIQMYNKQNGTKMTIDNVFNIAVDAEPLPQTTSEILNYPCKTLAGANQCTEISFEFATSARVIVSAGNTYTTSDLSTKFLKGTVMSSLVLPFIDHFNAQNGTKKTKADVKGLVIDGETPNDKLSSVTAQKCSSIIRDPRQTEIRLLLAQ